jgi:hypothetical protein
MKKLVILSIVSILASSQEVLKASSGGNLIRIPIHEKKLTPEEAELKRLMKKQTQEKYR